MKLLFIIIGTLCYLTVTGIAYAGNKETYTIQTDDIPRFWQAYDSLAHVHNHADSVNIIRRVYLEKMSNYGKQFIRRRQYTAAEYVAVIEKHPRYFIQLREKTAGLLALKPVIDSAYSRMAAIIPGFSYPDVCFAIGCFRGGGTATKNKKALLIGCEIALADSTMDISEFTGELHTLFSHADGNVSALIAHESVHCLQWNGQNNSLLSIALAEGTADFLTQLALHTNINKALNGYGLQHECELWKQFQRQMDGSDISQWFYNTNQSTTRPADLGYFMGRRICEAYYDKQPDKKETIINLLNRGKYLQVMQESGYSGSCGQ